ncbi:MAG: hypothetical protein KGS44_05145 [Alphaproteobacteria bacterium]|nr:hypothetical protein [Alphaproteobacteria bacterium]
MSARTIHRKLAWVAGLVAVLWSATGFLHPVMSWTAPRPAVQAPPVQAVTLDGLMPPATALAAAGVTETTLVRLVMVDGKPYWFAARENTQRTVLDAKTGTAVTGVEERHAIGLARHYAGLPDAEVETTRLITAFSTDYPSVNRLLPVWEVRVATPDGLTLYVDTGLDRLAAVTNDQRRVLLSIFQNVHTLKFLEPIEPLRLAAIFALIGTVIATTVFGATMLWRSRGRGLRRVHTLAAWAALPLVAMFTLSGTLHLFVTSSLWAEPAPRASPFAVSQLPPIPGAEPGITVNELTAAGGPLWRLQVEETGYYFGANAPDTDEDRARALGGAPAEASVSRVTRFGDGYGFINKRLPVWRVDTQSSAVFVDVREGLIAARPNETLMTRLEGWTFDNLHKWEFLNPLGRRNRDYATMAATAIVILVAMLGFVLTARRKRQS